MPLTFEVHAYCPSSEQEWRWLEPKPVLMKRLTVLLTGPGGRIGPHLLPSFQERYDLRLLDKNPVPGFPNTILSDLQDRALLREAMANVDVVVHLAATSDEAPFLEELVPNNVIGVYNVFEAAREAGVRRIVFASTVQTIGYNPSDRRVEIADPPQPISMYGVTKVFGEVLGRWYHDKHGLEFVAIRIGAFQPNDSPYLRQTWGLRDIWLSPQDCAGLLHRAIEKEKVGYSLVFGTSVTEKERMSRAPMRDLLDYEPQDDVASIPLEDASLNT